MEKFFGEIDGCGFETLDKEFENQLNRNIGEMGVKILGVDRSREPFGRYFDPAAPQADENGYFYLPNVSMPHEMVTLKHTEMMFDANIGAFKSSMAMYRTAVELLK